MSYKCSIIYSVHVIRMDIKSISIFFFAVVNITGIIVFIYICIPLGKFLAEKLKINRYFKIECICKCPSRNMVPIYLFINSEPTPI